MEYKTNKKNEFYDLVSNLRMRYHPKKIPRKKFEDVVPAPYELTTLGAMLLTNIA